MFECAVEEVSWVRHQILIERIGLGDQRDAGLLCAADASAALPGCHLASRVSDEQADIEASDVDPERESRSRDYAQQLAAE